MISLNLLIDKKLFGTIKIPEDQWALSEYKTYEVVYIEGTLTQPNKTGYSYNLWLKRPLARERR